MTERPGLGNKEAFGVFDLLQDFNGRTFTLLEYIQIIFTGGTCCMKLSVKHANRYTRLPRCKALPSRPWDYPSHTQVSAQSSRFYASCIAMRQ